MNEDAPLFADTQDLAQWVFGHFHEDERVLARALCTTSLELAEAVGLALANRDRMERIAEADDHLIRLRVQLRLALSAGYLSERQMLYAAEGVREIGKQLGGWQRKLRGR